MADKGKLIFPVKFDLENAVRAASGDIDKVLRRVQSVIYARPLVIKPTVDDKDLNEMARRLQNLDIGSGSGKIVAAEGSIQALDAAISKCIDDWNKLSEAERIADRASGEYTDKAKTIIKRMAALTGASQTYAKSLQEIVREHKNAITQTEKRIEKSRQTVAVLKAEENTIDNVSAKIRIYQQIANSHDPGSKEFAFATKRLEELGVAYERLAEAKRRATGNTGKDAFSIEKLSTSLIGPEDTIRQVQDKLKSLRQLLTTVDPKTAQWKTYADEMLRLNGILDTYNRQLRAATAAPVNMANIAAMPEKSIADLTAKIQAYQNLMRNSDFGSKEFTNAMLAASGLTTKLEQVNKIVAEREKWRTFQQAITQAANTIDSLNQRMSAWQSRMNGLEIGSHKWLEAAKNVARLSQELAHATQWAQDFQQKAFQGLSSPVLQKKVEETRQLRDQLQSVTEQFNRLQSAGLATDKSGNFTAKAIPLLQQRAELIKKIADKTRDADSAQETYNKKLADEEARLKHLVELEEKRRKHLQESLKVMQASEQRIEGINQKLQRYQSILQKQQVGSDAWNKTALEIKRLSEELERANRRLADFQQKSFQGVSGWLVDEQVRKLQTLRAEIDSIDSALHANNQMAASGRGGTMTQQQINDLLDQRRSKQKEIAQITKSAADMALDREKQINAVIEQRKAKQAQLKAQHQAEIAATKKKREENDRIRKILAAEETTIKSITAKLQVQQNRLRSTNLDSARFTRIAAEVKRLTEQLDNAQRKMDALTGKTTDGTGRQERAFNRVNEQLRKQSTYVERLVQRMAVYASFNALGNLLTNIRETTAQFELQRVSLGAIIQNQNRADQLFSEIKQFALTSPVSILDLTKYTKQVAAYRVETDKLFDTTKRLADVSVGLGVDMGRIVLAYGQVRAASYLRAAEIRQFTEAGIPMLELLSEKLTKLNGELVTTEKVMDLVSKRGIDFKMVEEIFNDMTSAGGMFYNMQEKQGNTLYGMWQKLGDAASMMYDEIGNTGAANSAMRGFIETTTAIMRNWKSAGAAITAGTVALGLYILKNKATVIGIKQKELADQKVAAAEEHLEAATRKRIQTEKIGIQADIDAAVAAEKKADSDLKAAKLERNKVASMSSTRMGFKTMMGSLVSGLGISIAITAVTTLIYKIGEAIESSTRLKNKLSEIRSETNVLQDQSVRNFERLVKTAMDSPDGSKAQKDAIDELNRTYKDMVPEEALKIENLRAMNKEYGALTDAVREYIAAQQQQKAINSINEEEGAIQTSMYKKLRQAMMDKDLGTLALDEGEINRFFDAFRKTSLDESKSLKDRFTEAFKLAGLNGSEAMWKVVKRVGKDKIDDLNIFALLGAKLKDSRTALNAFSESVGRQTDMLEANQDSWSGQTAQLGEYTQRLVNYRKEVEESLISGDTFLANQENNNMRIKKMEHDMRVVLGNVKIKWQDGWSDIVESVDPNNLNRISQLNMEAILSAVDPNKYPDLHKYITQFQKEYYGLVPQNATVQQIRAKLFLLSDSFGVSMDKMRQYLWDGSGDVDAYLKRLKEQQEELKARLKEKETTLAHWTLASGIITGKSKEEIQSEIEETKKLINALDQQIPFVTEYTNQKDKNKGRGSDTRLQTLQEINQTLEKINKEYNDLYKKEGDVRALNDIKRQFKDTLDYTNKIGKRFGLSFDFPTQFESLQKYRAEILKVMKSLKNLKGGEKAILEFQTMIAKADSDELQRQIDKLLKDTQEKIARTKTAKEFFEKILSQTGNEELAVRITYSIYPETGKDLYTDMQDQIRQVFRTGDTAKDNALRVRLDAVFDDESERINYRELDKVYAEYQNDIIEKNRDTARKLIAEGQKTAAADILNWEKMYAKAKSFEEQRTDIINREATERAKIYKSNLPQDVKDRLVEQSRKKQDEDISKVNFEEFTKSEDYIKIFENLGNASTASLKRLRAEMEKIIATNKNLSPENMKTLVKAMEDIESEVSGRGFGNDMVQSVKDYTAAIRDLKAAKTELKSAQAEYDAQLPMLDANIKTAKAEEIAAQEALNALLADELADKDEIVSAELRLNAATANVERVEQKKADAANKVKKAESKVTDQQDKQKKATSKFFKDLQKVSQTAGQLADVIGKVKDLIGLASDSAAGVVFDSAIEGLETFSKSMNLIIGLQELYNIVTASNPWLAIASAVLAVGSILGSWITNEKVRKANKEIERQQKLLDQLSYAYNRLQVAADKLFGADWLSNFNQQEKALQAEAEAYRKQAEAEKSKGKKKDKAKVKEYEEAYRDTMDELADMYGTLSQQMLGTDLTSAARDFAQAWLEAYKEFGKTSDAMSEKFRDMIQNMVVEGALARVMERALTPMFEMIDNMDESDFYNQDFWKRVVVEAEKGAAAADTGAATMMKFLEQAGISLRDTGSELTGIARTYANTSESDINGLAAATNTQNYYMQQISGEVQIIRRLIETGSAGTPAIDTGAADLLEIQRQSMDRLAAIERNTAETVSECRRIARSCDETLRQLSNVVDYTGGGKARLRVKM